MVVQALSAAEHGVECCDTSPEAPCVVYVSKMVAVPAAALPRYVNPLSCLLNVHSLLHPFLHPLT